MKPYIIPIIFLSFPISILAQDDYWRRQNLKNDEVRNAEQRQRDIENKNNAPINTTGSWDKVGNNIAEFILNKNKKVEVEYDPEYEEFLENQEYQRRFEEEQLKRRQAEEEQERLRKLNSPNVTQRYADGTVYVGQMYNDDGKFNGKGKLTLANGVIYEGDFLNDEFIFGKVLSPNGNKFEGQFSNTKTTTVKATFHNGVIYEGEFYNYHLTGKGKYTYPDGTTQEGFYDKGELVDYAKIIYNADTDKVKKGDIYEGQIQNGKKHGRGKYTHSSGKIDDGYWVNGDYVGTNPPAGEIEREFVNELTDGRLGKGQYKVKKVVNGNFYEGYMFQDKKEGFGKLTFSNGEFLEGEFSNDKFINGVEKYSDGTIKYQGTWKNQKYYGYGTLYNPNGKIKKSGYWKEGEFVTEKRPKFEIAEGHSTEPLYYEMYSGKKIYEGALNKDRQPHGFGIMIYPNKDKYVGQFVNGLRHGKGKFSNAEETIIYEGDFLNDTKTGKAKFIDLNHDIVYIGDYVNGEFKGNGKVYFKSGAYYEGEFSIGMLFGFGKFVYADGRVYIGEFERNNRNGKGKMTYPDGTVEDGIWVENVFQK